jgi:hypothetical protein
MKTFSAGLLILMGLLPRASAAATPHYPGPSAVRRQADKSKRARRRRVTDLDAFARALRARGLKVEAAGAVSQPFFSPEGRAFTVAGENVQVFRYPSVLAAEAEAKKVNAGGTAVGTSSAMWVGPPHFYRKGRLVVLYVGDNGGVLKALTAVLGPQFAGK